MPQWPWNTKRAVTRAEESPIAEAITDYLKADRPEEWVRIAETGSSTAISADVLAEVRRRAHETHAAGKIIESGRLERLAFFLQAALDSGVTAGATTMHEHAEEISQVLTKYLDALNPGMMRQQLEQHFDVLTTDEAIGEGMTMVKGALSGHIDFVAGSVHYRWAYPHRVQLLHTLQTLPLEQAMAQYEAAESKAFRKLDRAKKPLLPW